MYYRDDSLTKGICLSILLWAVFCGIAVGIVYLTSDKSSSDEKSELLEELQRECGNAARRLKMSPEIKYSTEECFVVGEGRKHVYRIGSIEATKGAIAGLRAKSLMDDRPKILKCEKVCNDKSEDDKFRCQLACLEKAGVEL